MDKRVTVNQLIAELVAQRDHHDRGEYEVDFRVAGKAPHYTFGVVHGLPGDDEVVTVQLLSFVKTKGEL